MKVASYVVAAAGVTITVFILYMLWTLVTKL